MSVAGIISQDYRDSDPCHSWESEWYEIKVTWQDRSSPAVITRRSKISYHTIKTVLLKQNYQIIKVLTCIEKNTSKCFAMKRGNCVRLRSMCDAGREDNEEKMKTSITVLSTQCITLTLKHRETHGCVVSTAATDALVLKHQVISILNAD